MYHRLSDVKINKLGLSLSGSWAVPLAANPVQQPVPYLPVRSCNLLTSVGNRGNVKNSICALWYMLYSKNSSSRYIYIDNMLHSNSTKVEISCEGG